MFLFRNTGTQVVKYIYTDSTQHMITQTLRHKHTETELK